MNNLISDDYRRVLEHEHSTTEWGVVGWKQAPRIYDLVKERQIKTLLDYGAGRGSLGHWFAKNAPDAVDIREYEPGIPRLASMPSPAEMVTCIDVMEHIEPDCIDSVLDHIQSLAEKLVYFNISTRLAGRILVDGRNAHLTVETPEWWCERLRQRWHEEKFALAKNGQGFNWFGSVRP